MLLNAGASSSTCSGSFNALVVPLSVPHSPRSRSGIMPVMNKLAPFLWFNDNAEEAAEFFLSVFPHARRIDELRSKGIGPWPAGKIATITIELEGQEMVFLNGGPAYQLNPAFSFFVRCDSQEEIDSYWDKLIE